MCFVQLSPNALEPLQATRRCGGGCRACPWRKRKPTLGLVMGGGGAKAAAHIGVLKVFQQAGITVDSVTAASAGALVGLFHCAGYSPEEMLQIMTDELVPGGWRRWLPGSHYWQMIQLLRGGKLQQLIHRYISVKNIEQLDIPLAVSATDLERGETVILDRGPIESALMATMCLPGLGRPVRRDGRWLIDGSVLCDLPVEPLVRQKISVKVGVNLMSVERKLTCGERPIDARWQSWQVISQTIAVQLRRLANESLSALDLIIRPDLRDMGLADFRRLPAIVQIGQVAAHHSVGKILQLFSASHSSSKCGSLATG